MPAFLRLLYKSLDTTQQHSRLLLLLLLLKVRYMGCCLVLKRSTYIHNNETHMYYLSVMATLLGLGEP